MVKKTSYSQERSSKESSGPTPNLSTKTFTIQNELGLHARAAAQFVKIANRYQSDVLVQKDSREVNGKSIMGILMLAASKGSQIRLKIVGSDSKEALEDLGGLIENNFGEK